MSGFLSRLRLDYIDGHVWEVVEPFEYCLGEPEGPERVIVPAGFPTDFASIPRALWTFLPPTGKYGKATLIHDALYQNRMVTIHVDEEQTIFRLVERGEADSILKEGMEVLKVGWFTRQLVYSGVRVGGWLPWKKYREAEESATP
jgi:hypothetical protein